MLLKLMFNSRRFEWVLRGRNLSGDVVDESVEEGERVGEGYEGGMGEEGGEGVGDMSSGEWGEGREEVDVLGGTGGARREFEEGRELAECWWGWEGGWVRECVRGRDGLGSWGKEPGE